MSRRLRRSPTARKIAGEPPLEPPPYPLWSRNDAARAVAQLYEHILGRQGAAAEQEGWIDLLVKGQISATDLINGFAMGAKNEAAARRTLDVSDAEFVRIAYTRIYGYVPNAREMVRMEHELRSRSRRDLVADIFESWAVGGIDSPANDLVHDPSQVDIMGTGDVIDASAWIADHPLCDDDVEPVEPRTYSALGVRPRTGIVASVITSLYGGADYIDKFLRNITSQTIIDRCEIIIIDAASPDGEFEMIKPYLDRFPNMVYERTPSRIGIYEAWNIGARMARGRYLTSASVDDLRRRDSLERQAEILDTFDFVDVVYQDFFYSLHRDATFDQAAALGLRSRLPIITPQNLMERNYPHNAPMWRASLHEEVGFFNETYKSAGDAEFWWRVIAAQKTFFKINDPHVAYYVNPHGLSTALDTPGFTEWKTLHSTLGPTLISDWLRLDRHRFLEKLISDSPDINFDHIDVPDWRSRAIDELLRDLSASSRPSNPGLAQE